jgi:hypothetical protein
MHPESEHGLRVQLATALRERDEARERCRFYNCGGEPPCGKCITCQWDDAREALAAARRDLSRWPAVVREYVEHVGARMPDEGDAGCDECEALTALIALAAPGDGEEGK